MRRASGAVLDIRVLLNWRLIEYESDVWFHTPPWPKGGPDCKRLTARTPAPFLCIAAICFNFPICLTGLGFHICLRYRVTNCASECDVVCYRNSLWRNSITKTLRMCTSLLGFSRLFTTSGNECEKEHGVVRCSCLYATWHVLEMSYQGIEEQRPWMSNKCLCAMYFV